MITVVTLSVAGSAAAKPSSWRPIRPPCECPMIAKFVFGLAFAKSEIIFDSAGTATV